MAARLAAGRDPEYADLGTEHTVDLRTGLRWLETALPPERSLVFGAGRFAWHAFLLVHAPHPRAWVDTLSFAAIGSDVGNAIGAWCANPNHPVLSITGDGGFMMSGMTELTTAVQIGADLVLAVFNDASYGAEHIQFRSKDMEPGLSMFPRPDLAAVALALGADGVTVHNSADFEKADAAIRDRRGPLLIDIRMDADAVTMPGA
jgi:thiamine pyrophosphate-dependent acetolactate synthase large subunit-like protein